MKFVMFFLFEMGKTICTNRFQTKKNEEITS